MTPLPFEVALSEVQEGAFQCVKEEASKTKGQVRVLSSKVLQVSDATVESEDIEQANEASFLFLGKFRTDSVQGIKVVSREGPFFLIIPWSGGMMLAHEFVSLLPGAVPTGLYLNRETSGAWSGGVWSGIQSGDQNAYAVAASQNHALNEGIEWDWEEDRLRMKLGWALQAMPVAPKLTLQVMRTSRRGVVSREFGLAWYLERRRAFSTFLASFDEKTKAAERWDPPPLSLFFYEDIMAPFTQAKTERVFIEDDDDEELESANDVSGR